jgi:hypothetical protein
MYSRIKKIKKSLETSSTKIFLKSIGIKQIYIKNFININEKILEHEDNKLKILRLYLGYVNTNYNIYDSKSLDDEIEVFRLCGFTKRAAYRYVNCIRHVYKDDSTLNWIYRLVEGMICNNSHINLSNFLKECYKNIDTSIDDNSTDIQEEEDDEDDEDEDEEDYDSDDVILIPNLP